MAVQYINVKSLRGLVNITVGTSDTLCANDIFIPNAFTSVNTVPHPVHHEYILSEQLLEQLREVTEVFAFSIESVILG